MFGRVWGIAATALAFSALLLVPVSPAVATTTGSNLLAPPNAGICPVSTNSEQASCTFVQLTLDEDHAAGGGVQPRKGGVITRFRVASATPAPGTSSVKLRLRLVDPVNGFAFGGGLPYMDMPLAPGIHGFATQLPNPSHLLVGLDTLVTGAEGEAAAPLAHVENGAGTFLGWSPSLPEHDIPMPVMSEENIELLLGVVIEPDRDQDGYGDRTQDRCPEDFRRQAHCDRRPPRTKLTYAPHQDFLGKRKVEVYMRVNETGEVLASGQVEVSGRRTAIWSIHSDRRRLGRGDKRKLVLRVPAKAREAAEEALAGGRRVLIKVSAYAVDAFGNESGTTVATIRPKR